MTRERLLEKAIRDFLNRLDGPGDANPEDLAQGLREAIAPEQSTSVGYEVVDLSEAPDNATWGVRSPNGVLAVGLTETAARILVSILERGEA